MIYKCKDRKIRSINISLPDEIHPEGIVNLEDFKVQISHGSRLILERLVSMNIDIGFLFEPEKQLFIDILFKYKNTIVFDDFEMGLLRSEDRISCHHTYHTSHILIITEYSIILCDERDNNQNRQREIYQ